MMQPTPAVPRSKLAVPAALTRAVHQVHGTLLQLAALLHAQFMHPGNQGWPRAVAQHLKLRVWMLSPGLACGAVQAAFLTVVTALLAHPEASAGNHAAVCQLAAAAAAACRALLAGPSPAPAPRPSPSAGAAASTVLKAAPGSRAGLPQQPLEPVRAQVLKQAATLLLSQPLRRALQPAGAQCDAWPDRPDVELACWHSAYEARCAGLKALSQLASGQQHSQLINI